MQEWSIGNIKISLKEQAAIGRKNRQGSGNGGICYYIVARFYLKWLPASEKILGVLQGKFRRKKRAGRLQWDTD